MKKILVFLVVLVLMVTTTALAGERKVISEYLEVTIYDNDGVSLSSKEDNKATIEFNLDNIKPGEIRELNWSAKNISDKTGIINYLRIKATQDGGEHPDPEKLVDPDNSGDLASLLIATLLYQGKDYILPMDEVLSPDGMLYDPNITLESGESTDFKLTISWPNHTDDNLGQGDVMNTEIDIGMTLVE